MKFDTAINNKSCRRLKMEKGEKPPSFHGHARNKLGAQVWISRPGIP
jgi:hypothetical protein